MDILLLTLMLSLLLPGAAALVVRSLARVHPQLGTGTYLGLLGLLTAGLVLQGLKKLPAPETAALVLSLLSGAAFVFAYCRLSVIRTYLSYLIPAAVLFPLLFLLDSEIRKLILPEPDSEVGIESGARAPVVMVIFDEFPLISLLNGRREIDSNLFPNLAELAENSYWFRNATTNNESTLLSIPVILSGTLPRQRPFPLPLFREYPKNLFSLLSGSHDLRIREQVTGLNPRRIPAPFGPRFRLLAEDLSVAYLHLLLPPALASRWLPPVTQTWNQFLNPGAPGPIRRAWRDFRVDWSRRPDRFRNFVDSIRGNGSPALYFLHTMLPHASWKYLPSGKLYTLSERPGVAGVVRPNSRGLEVNQWLEDPWLVTQSYQRHLLQVTFLDRLVGELVRRLREEDLYDSTLLVLTADHGASFRPGDSRRRVTGTNYMDILPTLVEMLGIETEWPLDGQSALDTEAPERSEKIVYNDDGEKFLFDPRLEARWKSLDRKLALFAAANGELSEQDLYRIGPHAELVGERTDALVQGKSDLTVEIDGSHLFRQVDLDSSFLLSRISGRVVGSQGSRIGRTLAIGVNSTVGAVTRTSHLDGDTVFSALVPETSFRDGSNRIRIYETSSTGSSVALLPVEIPAPATYRLDAARGESLLVTPEGRKVPIGDRGVAGWVVSRLSPDRSRIFIGGWGADVENLVLPQAIVLFRDGEFLYAGRTGRYRSDVVKTYGSSEIDNSGYLYEFSLLDFAEPGDSQIRVFILSQDGRASESNYPQPGDTVNWHFRR